MEQEYFVIAESKIRDSTPNFIEKGALYEFNAKIFIGIQNGDNIFKPIIIQFYGRPPVKIKDIIQPDLECTLMLNKQNDNVYICDGANWYIDKKNKKIISFQDGKEISKEVILKKYPKGGYFA
ncbi:hypothetical protein AGMMS4952_26080 [Spirochaetia bacterium]|nr:hypothetical protein AGMMS4952_26080 [Spirochaetia bacterium]